MIQIEGVSMRALSFWKTTHFGGWGEGVSFFFLVQEKPFAYWPDQRRRSRLEWKENQRCGDG